MWCRCKTRCEEMARNKRAWEAFRDRRGIGDETGLPLQVFEEAGESMVKPCAEVLMTQRAAETISSRGIMPLASMKGEDRVRLLGVHSVARPETSLVGRWRRSQ